LALAVYHGNERREQELDEFELFLQRGYSVSTAEALLGPLILP